MTKLKQQLLAFEEFLNDDEAHWKFKVNYETEGVFAFDRAIEIVQEKFEELLASTPVPNQVNLELNQDNIDALKAALDREEIGVAQRPMTGYVGIRRKSKGIIGGDTTLCTLKPEEAVLLGLYLFGLGGLRVDPEFLAQFGLKIDPGEGAVKS